MIFCAATTSVAAQTDFNSINEDGDFRPASERRISTDSLGSNQEIPKGIKVWTVDERFGDQQDAVVDTLQHMYMNTTFTEGLRGEYNTLGNMGSPRIGRILLIAETLRDNSSSQNLIHISIRLSAIFISPTHTHQSPTSHSTHVVIAPMVRTISMPSLQSMPTSDWEQDSNSTTNTDVVTITHKVPVTSNIPCGLPTLVTNIRHICFSVPSTRR